MICHEWVAIRGVLLNAAISSMTMAVVTAYSHDKALKQRCCPPIKRQTRLQLTLKLRTEKESIVIDVKGMKQRQRLDEIVSPKTMSLMSELTTQLWGQMKHDIGDQVHCVVGG